MHRFPKNRWWTLILTLVLCFGAFATPRPVHADDPQQFGDPSGSSDGQGDPDVPDNPIKSRGISHGTMRPSTNTYAARRPAGDGSAIGSVMMWRLRVALWSLRVFLVRF